jgi:hypothetical protein
MQNAIFGRQPRQTHIHIIYHDYLKNITMLRYRGSVYGLQFADLLAFLNAKS